MSKLCEREGGREGGCWLIPFLSYLDTAATIAQDVAAAASIQQLITPACQRLEA